MESVGQPTLSPEVAEALDERLRAGVAHDLRNPLTALVQIAESISAREVLTPAGRAELAGLLQAAKGALRRADTLTAGSGDTEECERVLATTALRDVVAVAARHTGFPPSMVQWRPAGSDPVTVLDAEHFRRALEHLLANVRSHASGTASVVVDCSDTGVAIEVADRGAPISELPAEGSGLSYVRRVVEAHGGTVSINPRSTGGLVVRTEWPGAVEMRTDSGANDDADERPLRVFFADDEALVRKALSRLLRGTGYDVVTYDSGDALLEALGTVDEVPDVVICDADMPGTHGLDVLARVRLIAPSAARVLYTAYQPTGRVVEAFNKGSVQRFIRKGQDANEIESCLAGLAEERKVLGTTAERRDNSLRVDFEKMMADRMCTLFLQPIFDARTREIVACEALLRSKHPSFRGPLDIIDTARAFSREHALQNMLAGLAAELRTQLPPHVMLFVNVDPACVREPDRLDEAFAPLYAGAENVMLEITERASLGDSGAWQQSVKALRERGFRIALDDVGAGYNSLGAVLAVNPDVIKLDISLISGLHNDRAKADLVGLLSDYARRQGVATVAEGIEEAEEAARCIELGVRWLQGYHLARPAPIEDLFERFFAPPHLRSA